MRDIPFGNALFQNQTPVRSARNHSRCSRTSGSPSPNACSSPSASASKYGTLTAIGGKLYLLVDTGAQATLIPWTVICKLGLSEADWYSKFVFPHVCRAII